MKVAYIGDFLNHGGFLYTSGTPIVILLSLFEGVDSIEVFSPDSNRVIENFVPPSKVIINPFYRREDPFSILKLLTVDWSIYDIVIFNMLPTGFGVGTVANFFALMIPILLKRLWRNLVIKIIYHNSVYTNDIKSLGYRSAFDKFRSFFLKIVEKYIFKNITTFVLLKLYKIRIDKTLKINSVQVLDSKYLEAVTTVYLNNSMNLENIVFTKQRIPIILMHGSWGPQKNIELGLAALKALKNKGVNFKLIISGGVNEHFPEYKIKFKKLLDIYSDVIDQYLGPITEREIMHLFLTTSLIILPYNSPGGHSGVLEQAIFFEVPTVAIEFPEYKEQAAYSPNVELVQKKDFTIILTKMLEFANQNREINIRSKILIAKSNVEILLNKG